MVGGVVVVVGVVEGVVVMSPIGHHHLHQPLPLLFTVLEVGRITAEDKDKGSDRHKDKGSDKGSGLYKKDEQ